MLDFDISQEQLFDVIEELEPTEKQIKLAFNRALNRTAATLRRLSAAGLKQELDLRATGLLRERLKTVRLKQSDVASVRLWYGVNGMPVSWFKGRATQSATGAQFRDAEFEGGFVAKSKVKGRKTVFKRKESGRLPLVEQLMPIRDKAQVFVEDEIFVQIEDIFWPVFIRDLKARLKFKIGAA